MKQKFPTLLTPESGPTDIQTLKSINFATLTNFESIEIGLFSDVLLNKPLGLLFEFLHFYRKFEFSMHLLYKQLANFCTF